MICFGLWLLVLTRSQLAHAAYSNGSYVVYHDDHTHVRNLLATTDETASGQIRLALDTYLHPNYCKTTIPVRNYSQQIELHLRVSLRKILEVEEFKQQIKVQVWVHQTWNDEYLVWNPEDYEGVSTMRVKHSSIWVPDMVLYSNGDEDQEPLDYINAIITHEGHVMYMYPAVYKVACNIDVRYFPFDQQDCDLAFGSWSYDTTKVKLLQNNNSADSHGYSGNTAWDLVNFTASMDIKSYSCCPEMDFQRSIFKLTIRRYWSIHFFYMFIPITLIQLLAVLQFLLPCDSGEKISLGITIYLSMLVYLLMVYELLPSTEYIPLMVEYIVSTLFLVATAQVSSICVLMIYHNGTHDNHNQLPGWARDIFLHKLAGLVCMSRYITSDEDHARRLSKNIMLSEIFDVEKLLPRCLSASSRKHTDDSSSEDVYEHRLSDKRWNKSRSESVESDSSIPESDEDEHETRNVKTESESKLDKECKHVRVSICKENKAPYDNSSKKRCSADRISKAFISGISAPKEPPQFSKTRIEENEDDELELSQEIEEVDNEEVTQAAIIVDSGARVEASSDTSPRRDSSESKNKVFESDISVLKQPSKFSMPSIQELEDEDEEQQSYKAVPYSSQTDHLDTSFPLIKEKQSYKAVPYPSENEKLDISIPLIKVSNADNDGNDSPDTSSHGTDSLSNTGKISLGRQPSWSIQDTEESDDELELKSEMMEHNSIEKAETMLPRKRLHDNDTDHNASTETNSNMRGSQCNAQTYDSDVSLPRQKSKFPAINLFDNQEGKPELNKNGKMEGNILSSTESRDSSPQKNTFGCDVSVLRQKSKFSITNIHGDEQEKVELKEREDPKRDHGEGEKKEDKQRRDSSERKNKAFDSTISAQKKSEISIASIAENEQENLKFRQSQKYHSSTESSSSVQEDTFGSKVNVPRQKSKFSITSIHKNKQEKVDLKEIEDPKREGEKKEEKQRRDSSQRKNKAFESSISLPRHKSTFSIASIAKNEQEKPQLRESQKDPSRSQRQDSFPGKTEVFGSNISVPRQKSSFSITNIRQSNETIGLCTKEVRKPETPHNRLSNDEGNTPADTSTQRRDSSRRKNKTFDSTISLPRQKSKFSIASIPEIQPETSQLYESVSRDRSQRNEGHGSEKSDRHRRDSSERKNKAFCSTVTLHSQASNFSRMSIQEMPEEECKSQMCKPKEKPAAKTNARNSQHEASTNRKSTQPKATSRQDELHVQPCKFKGGKRKVDTRKARARNTNNNVNQCASHSCSCSQDCLVNFVNEDNFTRVESHICQNADCDNGNLCGNEESLFHVENELNGSESGPQYGLYHVLAPGATFSEADECKKCHTLCQPAFMSCSHHVKTCKCQLLKRLDDLDYNYILCCCQCMKDTVTERGWSQILVPIQSQDDLPEKIEELSIGSRCANTNINNPHMQRVRRTSDKRSRRHQSPVESFDKTKLDNNQEQLLFRIYKVLRGFKQRLSDEDGNVEVRCEWQQVAMVLDRILFFVFALVAVFIIGRVYLKIPIH